MRQTLVVGNWKMHGTRASVSSLLGEVAGSKPAGGAEVAVCPSYVHLSQAVELCAGSDVAVGAQDCSHMQSGAYTGEVSAQMLVDQGCRWVILGHSERRQYFGETDETVNKRLKAALTAEGDGDRTANHLHHGHHGADDTVAENHAVHDFGNTVPLGLPGKEIDQRSHDQAPDGRSQNTIIPRQIDHQVQQVLLTAVGQGLKKIDQISKTDSAEASGQSHNNAQYRHNRMFIGL